MAQNDSKSPPEQSLSLTILQKYAKIAFLASIPQINDKNVAVSFELFGLDYMITDDLKVKLIEINNNPSLTINSHVTGKLIPKLIDDTFKIGLDPYFRPSQSEKQSKPMKKGGSKNWDIGDFELIFDSL